MNEKNFYTDEQVSKIKKQWLRVWMGAYGFLAFIVIISLILFAYHKISAETLGNGIYKVTGAALEGLLFAFLPLYYCAYQKPGTRLIGCWILLNLVIIAYDFICFCIDFAMTLQGGFTITTCLVASALYCLQLLWKGYFLLVFYRLYRVNLFLQEENN
jgi:hypothetical protein